MMILMIEKETENNCQFPLVYSIVEISIWGYWVCLPVC